MRAKLVDALQVWRRRVLLALVVGIPVLFLRTVSDPINVPKLALLFSGVSIALALRAIEFLQERSWGGLKRMWVPAAALAGALAISWAISAYRGWALIGEYGRFQGLLPYLATIAAGVLIAESFAGRAHVLAWAVSAAAGIVALYGCLQVLHLDPFTWGSFGAVTHTAGSTLGNPEFTGGFLAVSLPLTIGLYLATDERRWAAVVLGALIAIGLVLTFSQGAWIAGLAGLSIAAAYAFSQRARWVAATGMTLAAVLAVAVVAVVIFSAASPDTKKIPDTVRFRGQWWIAAAKMGADSPIVGWGPSSFFLRGTRYRTVRDALELGYSYTDDPHSVPLALFANAGVLGLGAFAFVVFWSVRRFPRARDRALPAAFVGAVTAAFVQALGSIDELTFRFLFWAVVAGLVASLAQSETSRAAPVSSGGKRRRTQRRHDPVRFPALVPVIAIVAILPIWWSVEYLVADAHFRHATNLLSQGQVEPAQADYEAARGFRPDPDYRRHFGASLGGLVAGVGKQAAPLFPRVTSAFGYLSSIPDEAGLVDYAQILSQWANVEARDKPLAADYYKRAVALDPANPAPRMSAAAIYLQLQRYADAIDVLRPGTQVLDDRYAPVWGALALAQAHTGETTAARASVQKAMAIDPNDGYAQEALTLLEGSG